MSIMGMVAAGTALVDIAHRLYTNSADAKDMAQKGANNLVRMADDDNYNAKSLTQRAKKCFIESRAYVDKAIEHEKVLPPLMKHILAFQVSLVLTSLKLDGLVSDGITVSNRLRSVASEDYRDVAADLRKDSLALENIGNILNPSLEFSSAQDFEHEKEAAFRKAKKFKEVKDEYESQILNIQQRMSSYQQLLADARLAKNKPEMGKFKALVEKDKAELKALTAEYEKVKADLSEELDEANRYRRIDSSDITPSTDVSISMGAVKEITFQGPNGQAYTVPIYIKVNPYMVDSELVSYLMETTGSAFSTRKRLEQYKAGEITFFKDFLGGMDLVKRMEKNLRKDKSGEFAAYIAHTVSKENKRVRETLMKLADSENKRRTSSNLANAILIFSESSVKEGQRRGGINLENRKDRQRFFDKNFASMIFVIDASHEHVTMYLNGFESVGHYTYSEFIRKKDIEGEDFMSILRAVSTDNLSRF